MNKTLTINRYNKNRIITSSLDPIEDVTNLISGLTSIGFTTEILSRIHCFTDKKKAKESAKSISLLIKNSLSLMAQANAGPVETSFLPLYYSVLSMSKVQIILDGNIDELKRNRAHGARYREEEMVKNNFLNEQIEIMKRGSLNLLFKTLMGEELGKRKMLLKEVYPFIRNIGAEYGFVVGKSQQFQQCYFYAVVEGDKYYFRTEEFQQSGKKYFNPKKFPAFKGFWTRESTEKGGYFFRTKSLDYLNDDNVFSKADDFLNRSLFIDYPSKGFAGYGMFKTTLGYNGRSGIEFPEEFLILLAYFHLSNIVRYNPEHLYKLMDSKYWTVLLALRRHAFLRYCFLFWSHVTRSNFHILVE